MDRAKPLYVTHPSPKRSKKMKALDLILSGKIPVVNFGSTYDLHDELVDLGYFHVDGRQKRCAKDFSMIVDHGRFLTWNIYNKGKHNPRIVDVTLFNGFYFHSHTGELIKCPENLTAELLAATRDKLHAEGEHIKASRLKECQLI